MKTLKKLLLLLVAISMIGWGFSSCSDDDDDDDNTVMLLAVKQQQDKKAAEQKAAQKAEEEKKNEQTAPEDIKNGSYTDSSGNNVTVNTDSSGTKTETKTDATTGTKTDKDGNITITTTDKDGKQDTQTITLLKTIEGINESDSGTIFGIALKMVSKGKILFYSDNTYKFYYASYTLENGKLAEGASDEYTLTQKGSYSGDITQDGTITTTDNYSWTMSASDTEKCNELYRDYSTKFDAAMEKAQKDTGKTDEEIMALSEEEFNKLIMTPEVEASFKAADDFQKSAKLDWYKSEYNPSIIIKDGKLENI